jgi:pimeloyl-ACP methyl ester carboxylesterase
MEPSVSLFFLDPHPTGERPVLLLHGLGADGASWALQFPALAAGGFRPLAVDMPGFGQSAALPGGWSLRAAARAVMQGLQSRGIPRVDVVGISMGGAVAQLIALEDADRVGKLVLVNTFACLRPRGISETAYLLRRFVVANLRGVQRQAGAVAWRVFPDPEQQVLRDILMQKILAADPQVYRAAMRALAWFDSRPRLAAIRQPTLIITGEKDTTVPRTVQTELLAIPNARQIIIPGANHAVIADQPERFNQALLQFLLA